MAEQTQGSFKPISIDTLVSGASDYLAQRNPVPEGDEALPKQIGAAKDSLKSSLAQGLKGTPAYYNVTQDNANQLIDSIFQARKEAEEKKAPWDGKISVAEADGKTATVNAGEHAASLAAKVAHEQSKIELEKAESAAARIGDQPAFAKYVADIRAKQAADLGEHATPDIEAAHRLRLGALSYQNHPAVSPEANQALASKAADVIAAITRDAVLEEHKLGKLTPEAAASEDGKSLRAALDKKYAEILEAHNKVPVALKSEGTPEQGAATAEAYHYRLNKKFEDMLREDKELKAAWEKAGTASSAKLGKLGSLLGASRIEDITGVNSAGEAKAKANKGFGEFAGEAFGKLKGMSNQEKAITAATAAAVLGTAYVVNRKKDDPAQNQAGGPEADQEAKKGGGLGGFLKTTVLLGAIAAGTAMAYRHGSADKQHVVRAADGARKFVSEGVKQAGSFVDRLRQQRQGPQQGQATSV